MPLQSNVKKYYLHNFLKALSFWLPIFVLYFLSNGLNYAQVMVLIAVQSVFLILFEIPSGVYSDYYGRKNSLIISAVLKVACLSFYFFGNNFLLFAFAAAFFGMSLAFESGSDSAFIYDSLKDLGRESEYKKIEGRAFSYRLLGMAIGAFFGGPLAGISLKIPVLLTLCAYVLATVVPFSFTEPRRYKKSADRDYLKHLKEAVIFSRSNPNIKWLVVFSGLMATAMLVSQRFFQPYMQAAGIPIAYFGGIYFVWLVFSALAAVLAHRIEARVGQFYSLLIIPVLLGLQLIIIGSHIFIYGVAVILLGEFTWGFLRPVVNDYINRQVRSHQRATILSFNGFFQGMMLIILSPVFGYFADVFSLTTALLLEGIVVLVLGIPLVLRISNLKAPAGKSIIE